MMNHQRTSQHTNSIHQQHDDWDEVHNQLLSIQKKSLEVNDPNDANEKEADEVARKVVDGQSAEIHGTSGTINRKGEGSFETSPEFQSQLESSKGSGQSLPGKVQQEMGSKMGSDFSNVKVHTGNEASTMSENINAKAFTSGQDVYFGQGQFDTNSKQGKELLAHELVHTKQEDGKLKRQIKSDVITKSFDKLVLPEGDKIISVQIRRDSNKKIIFTEQFLGPLFASSYIARVPYGSAEGTYTFIVKTLNSGIKNVTLHHYGSFLGGAYLDITVKQPDPIAVKTKELKKFSIKLDPQNDASLISDTKLKETQVFIELKKSSTATQPADKEKEALLATRMMLRDVQDPLIGSVVKGKEYLTLAKKQLSVRTSMETNFVVGGDNKEGSFKWSPEDSVSSTDFSKWVNGTGPEPSVSAIKGSKSVNNCWGVIFYGAYKAGVASKAWIKDMYAATAARQSSYEVTSIQDPNERAKKITTVEDWISGGKYYDYDPKTKRPLAGDLVIWDTAYKHIVLATGKNDPTDGSPEVISLWTIPNYNYLQYTSIQKLTNVGASGKIKFFSPIWQ